MNCSAAFRMFCFALFAEAGNVAKLFFAGEFFDLGDGGAPEYLPEQRHFFRRPAIAVRAIPGSWADIFSGAFAQGVVAGLQDFVDVLGHALADAGKFA